MKNIKTKIEYYIMKAQSILKQETLIDDLKDIQQLVNTISVQPNQTHQWIQK